MNPEEMVLGINIAMITFAYSWLFARVEAFDMQKVMLYDSGVILVAVSVVGYLFYGKNIIFYLFGMEVDWLIFSIVTYFVMEVPFALWYFNKYDLWTKL